MIGAPSADGDSWALGPVPVVLAAGVCCATAMMVWLGYVSTREWQGQTRVLLEQRQAEALALASTALNRDMKGVWTTVLAPLNVFEPEDEGPYDFMRTAARAFARFPYPESFILWRDNGSSPPSTFVFNRTERVPSWDHEPPRDEPFPVTIARDTTLLAPVMALAREDRPSMRFVSVDASIAGVPYQVIAHRMFSTKPPHELTAMVAFTVNRQWVAHEYFGPLLRQVAQIGGNQDALTLSVSDPTGRVVATSGSKPTAGRDLRRVFPLIFLDPTVTSSPVNKASPVEQWTLHVNPSATNALLLAEDSTRQMFFLMALAAAISTAALLMTVRAIRASATLASMKSDFVAAVTHELKTPVAAIRLVGDTLAQRRYDSPETVADYARLLSQEAGRLSRSIDGMLTYAKYTAGRRAPDSLVACDAADIIDEALDGLRPMLEQHRFEVTVDAPRTLPPVAADRAALVQVVECLIDNAMKYSANARKLTIAARAGNGRVHITFSDDGIGIPPEDLAHVFDRFYRGRNVSAGGSGLGLTIARRILQAHGGTIGLRSTVGVGTEVEIAVPVAAQT